MKRFYFVTFLALAALILAGCSGQAAATATSSGNTFASKALTTSYQGALSAPDQLMLGTIRLEGTEQAVTVEQAKALLPLWQMLQSNTLKADAERNAVYAQIEAQMTPAQLSAIAAMQLTQQDLQAQPGQGAPPGGGQFGAMTNERRATAQASGRNFAPGGNMTDEQRQALRATAQAGGGPGSFGNMTDEQRAAMQATFQARGGAPGAAPRRGEFLLNALIRLLAQRASGEAASPGIPPLPPATPAP